MPSIAIAVDLSPCSRRAFDAGVHLARDLGVDIVVVHAFEPASIGLGLGGAMESGLSEGSILHDEEEARRLTTEWLNDARAVGVAASVVAKTTDDPAHLVLEEARRHGALMIVVGSHGRTGIGRLLLGSVAAAVVRRSDRPVLVVPDRSA